MMHSDDMKRENSKKKKAAAMKQSCEKSGWVPISMRDDWKTIYGEQ